MPLDYDKFLTTLVSDKILDMSATSVALCLSALTRLQKRYAWSKDGDKVDDTTWDEIDAMVALANEELMQSLVGMILPHVMSTVSDFKMLPCDGGVYLKSDYPLLYEAIDAEYIISGTQFAVPDMRDRVPVGTGSQYDVNDSGGVDAVTLVTEELPVHSHTTDPHTHTSVPHTHTYSSPTFGVDIESVGIPDPTGVGNPPVPFQTTPNASTINNANVTVNNTGNGEAHENRMPFRAVKFAIVAG